jgi:hypothetical protein
MEIGRWNGYIFEVSPSVVRGFTGLSVKASCETEDQETDGQKILTRKAANPAEATLTVQLCAYLGCDVRAEADAFLADAQNGAKDYFYVGGQKLLTCQMMLTDASVEEIQTAPGGAWTSCTVKLTMKQATKAEGAAEGEDTGSGSGTGSTGGGAASTAKKASVKTTSYLGIGAGTSLTSPTTTATLRKMETQVIKPSETSAFGKAVNAINAVVNAGKAASEKARPYDKAGKSAAAKSR